MASRAGAVIAEIVMDSLHPLLLIGAPFSLSLEAAVAVTAGVALYERLTPGLRLIRLLRRWAGRDVEEDARPFPLREFRAGEVVYFDVEAELSLRMVCGGLTVFGFGSCAVFVTVFTLFQDGLVAAIDCATVLTFALFLMLGAQLATCPRYAYECDGRVVVRRLLFASAFSPGAASIRGIEVGRSGATLSGRVEEVGMTVGSAVKLAESGGEV